MMVVDLVQRIYDKLGEEKKRLAEALVSGSPKDHASYQNLVGQYRGLEMAEDAVRELTRRQLLDDD
jgi:hypothetical protein